MTAIIVNMIMMASTVHPFPLPVQDGTAHYWAESAREPINFFCIVVFNVEFLLKFMAVHMNYFKDSWNRFDFLCVVSSDIGIVLVQILKLRGKITILLHDESVSLTSLSQAQRGARDLPPCSVQRSFRQTVRQPIKRTHKRTNKQTSRKKNGQTPATPARTPRPRLSQICRGGFLHYHLLHHRGGYLTIGSVLGKNLILLCMDVEAGVLT